MSLLSDQTQTWPRWPLPCLSPAGIGAAHSRPQSAPDLPLGGVYPDRVGQEGRGSLKVAAESGLGPI